MRKTFIGLFSAAILALSLSSCLGDGGDSTYQGTREFGVVSVSDGVTQASMVSGLIISGDDISKYSTGDVIQASYKVTMGNYITSTTLKAEYATVDDANDVYENSAQKSVIIKKDGYTPNNDKPFTVVSALYGAYNEFFLNRCLLSVSAVLKKDEDITSINLYYDPTRQTLEDNSTLPDDAVILDVELLKTTSVSGTTETSTKSKNVAINLTSFRNADPKNMNGSSTTKTLYIWLRFPKYTSSTDKVVTTVLQKALGITYTGTSTSN